ncbi:MAG: Sun protein [Polyangiaceae bacterium]|nr:Sun protein [Polyangiaceae bacterium]
MKGRDLDELEYKSAQTPARNAAAKVLVRVWQEEAFASAALDAELAKSRLDARDAGLATELCYGVLRTETALLQKLEEVSDRFKAPSGLVKAHLLIAAFSICFLDRIPPFAAVSEAVEASRRVADKRVGGFVNAVLRRLCTDVEKKGRPKLEDAVVATCPPWLKKALGKAVGEAHVRAYLTAGVFPPALGLCVHSAGVRAEVISRIQEALPKASVTAGVMSPHAILVRGGGDLRRLAGFGVEMIAQEEGAQFVGLSLGAKHGERVLDACAGHGNKTWQLQHAVDGGEVHAADVYAHKLKQIVSAAGKKPVVTHVVDWSKDGSLGGAVFDRVLLDAPCSGSGTLRRRPEIGRRRTPEDVARLSDLQRTMLVNAAQCVHNGARLVYAVCSVLREEAEEVVEAATALCTHRPVKLLPVPFDADVVRATFGEVASFRLLPHEHGTDGYFAASFRVERGS